MEDNNIELIPGDVRETRVTTEPGKLPGVSEVTTTVVDTHTVSAGETLSEITQAKTGDGSYSAYMEVAEANGIENPDLIYVGDKIEYEVSETTTIQRDNNPVPMDERPVALDPSPGVEDGDRVIHPEHRYPVEQTPSGYTPVNTSGGGGAGGHGSLNIEQASIGYDKMGMQAAVNRLNLIVFNGAAVAVRNAILPVNIAVDQCWAGQAADAFKAKFARDAETMCKTLESLEEEVRSQFAQIAKNVDNYDEAIAESIKEV